MARCDRAAQHRVRVTQMPTENDARDRTHNELHEAFKQHNDAAIKSGESAIKTVVLANGGAVVAVLAFLGNLTGKAPAGQISSVAGSLTYFAWGVAAGLIAMFAAYLTNLHYANREQSYLRTDVHPYIQQGPATLGYVRLSTTAHYAAILAGAISVALFVYGIYDVGSSIQRLKF
jgi:hypothetical protein